jgi:DUF1365 family protein
MRIPPAPGLYVGRTTHARPDGSSRFTYNLFSLLLDIDDLDTAARPLKLFSLNRFNLLSFHVGDHGDRNGAPLRPWVEAAFAAADVDLEGGPVRLLTMPRVLGYVFNPISLFFGYGPDGGLRGVIYAVNNTFGESHAYVVPASGEALERHSAEKQFHVSPFFDVAGAYQFRLAPPGRRFALTIRKSVAGKEDHIAIWTADRRPLSDRALLAAWLGAPLLTLKVVAAIHFEALRLWLKGARYHRKPPPPAMPFTIGRNDAAIPGSVQPRSARALTTVRG